MQILYILQILLKLWIAVIVDIMGMANIVGVVVSACKYCEVAPIVNIVAIAHTMNIVGIANWLL